MEKLQARNPKVAALFGLERSLFDRAFPDTVSWNNLASSEDSKLRHFGASLVPELNAGLFDLGFAKTEARKTCAGKSPCDLGITRSMLTRYVGPDVRLKAPTVTLVSPERDSLVKYVAPEYHPLARNGRLEGRATLNLIVDSLTGNVTGVQATSGQPVFVYSAEQAARQWKFQPSGPEPTRHVSAVLEFSLGCTATPVQ